MRVWDTLYQTGQERRAGEREPDPEAARARRHLLSQGAVQPLLKASPVACAYAARLDAVVSGEATSLQLGGSVAEPLRREAPA